MGFYIRKSLRVGPLRFNLSKSGVGVSAGLKGFRVGSGPRGNYVHMGRGGLYYRASLPSEPHALPTPVGRVPSAPTSLPSSPTVGPMQEIESGSVAQMVDSSAVKLLQEFNDKRKLLRFFPIGASTAVVALAGAWYAGAPDWQLLALAVAGTIGSAFLHMRDRLRKTVVVFYSFDPGAETSFQDIHDAFGALNESSRIWHLASQGRVLDRKYHAGASAIVQRSPITPTDKAPPFFSCNLDIPMIPVGRQSLLFMPERLLVFDSGSVGAVPYDRLRIAITSTQFIENSGVPRDSKVVGQTWQYVNKSGGPDRRFKDNRQLPIALYDEVHFSSDTGLNEVIQLSRSGAGTRLKSAVEAIARAAEQPGT